MYLVWITHSNIVHLYQPACFCYVNSISGLSHPFLGMGPGSMEIGVLTKIGKIYIVFMYEVSIDRLIPIVNLYLVS